MTDPAAAPKPEELVMIQWPGGGGAHDEAFTDSDDDTELEPELVLYGATVCDFVTHPGGCVTNRC